MKSARAAAAAAFASASCLLLLSCRPEGNPPAAPPPVTLTIPWTAAMVENQTLKLEAPRTVESFTFRPDGSVIATIGQKDGAVAGPVFRWALEKEKLVIRESDTKTYTELTLHEWTPPFLTTTRPSGDKAVYRVTRDTPPPLDQP